MLNTDKPWYIPAFIPEDKRGREPSTEDVVLFVLIDLDCGDEYIPVFDEYDACDGYLMAISPTKRDGGFAIYAFDSLSAIDRRVRQDFGRKVDLIVYSMDREVNTSGEDLNEV